MPAHLLRAAGLGTSVVPHDHPGLREALRHHRGPVLLGPGPGNPNDAADPRIGALRELTAELLGEARGGGNPTSSACASASSCCPFAVRGARTARAARRTPLPGNTARRGVLRPPGDRRFLQLLPRTRGSRTDIRTPGERSGEFPRPATCEVTALRGRGISGVQFHSESALSLSGPEILLELLREAVGRAPVAVSRKVSGSPALNPAGGVRMRTPPAIP
ncbi:MULTISPECIES: hypothetical protein [unclassified Streptomyces]|uniref:hypothetical protein n=1 Tax=Streptomyces TaxID=1883 RepID=UPI00359F89BC